MPTDRSENIAAVKSVADVPPHIFSIGDRKRPEIDRFRQHAVQKAIVRSDKFVAIGFNDKCPPVRPDARVDHTNKDRPARKILITGFQNERRRCDVLRWNFVGYIDDIRVCIYRENYAFHRRNIVILHSKIGEQRNDHKKIIHEFDAGSRNRTTTGFVLSLKTQCPVSQAGTPNCRFLSQTVPFWDKLGQPGDTQVIEVNGFSVLSQLSQLFAIFRNRHVKSKEFSKTIGRPRGESQP